MLLGATGVTGSLPLIAAMVPLAVGVAVALSIRSAVGEAEEEESAQRRRPARALTLAGALVAAAFLGGIGETAMQWLLPLYGLGLRLERCRPPAWSRFQPRRGGARGSSRLEADRFGRTRTLQICADRRGPTTADPAARDHAWAAVAPVLFLAGGTIAGIYTLGVILIGQDFRGQRLALVSTGFAMAYSPDRSSDRHLRLRDRPVRPECAPVLHRDRLRGARRLSLPGGGQRPGRVVPRLREIPKFAAAADRFRSRSETSRTTGGLGPIPDRFPPFILPRE